MSLSGFKQKVLLFHAAVTHFMNKILTMSNHIVSYIHSY